jgi:restriction system protein
MKPLFDTCGGYRKLTSFTFATLVHFGTIRFCRKFISYREDPLGKRTGQMVDAARSGRQNIIEGSERAATSKETEMKLTDVARASLAELLGDLEMFLADAGEVPWSVNAHEHQAVSRLNPDPFEYTEDVMHDYWTYFHRQKKAFDPWLEHESPTVVANALIVLVRRTMAMLGGQIRHQGAAFLEEGGVRERLTQCRIEVRDAEAEAVPTCPECGKPMRRRKAKSGPNAGQSFWGCTAYPACNGTGKVES